MKKRLTRAEEDKLAVKKMQEIDAEIESGKRKLVTEAEVLKLHPELKKYIRRE